MLTNKEVKEIRVLAKKYVLDTLTTEENVYINTCILGEKFILFCELVAMYSAKNAGVLN